MISKTFVAGVLVGMTIVAAVATTTFRAGAWAEGAPRKNQPTPFDSTIGMQDARVVSANDGANRGPIRGGEGIRRELSDQEIDRVIATVRDVNEQWADELVKLRQSDPKALRERLAREARKFIALSLLKEREPNLYRVRVDDMRVQNQIRELGEAWNAAQKSGDASAQELLMKDIQANARKQVELDIQARGFEFVALDKSLKDARKRLQDDIRDRDQTIARIIDAIRKGQDPKFGRRSTEMIGGMSGMGARVRDIIDNGTDFKPAPLKPQ